MDDRDSINTGGGAFVDGNISTGGGDFVGRDQIEQLIQHLEQKNVQGDYVERQEITNNFLVLGPEAMEELASWLAAQQGLDKEAFQNLGAQKPPEHMGRQIEEVQAAQREATAKGVPLTSQAAYKMGMLAFYRRDYQSALEYFHQATRADPEFSDGFEGIAWVLQSWALDDLREREYSAALEKLEAASAAAKRTDPLDVRALNLRGYIAVTLAQTCQGMDDPEGQHKYYQEAARLFEGVVKLNPEDPSAYNGLGNVEHARGNLDAAISARKKALNLAPGYTAAWHDLAITCEAKMEADPGNAKAWCQEALQAWVEVYHLAPDDPSFSAEFILQVGKRVRLLEERYS